MILLLDIDGTLVDHTTHLPPSAEAAVRAAVAAGHRLYACTGRARAEVYPELWDLGLHGMIGGNGSYVESDGAVLLHQVLDPDAVGCGQLARHRVEAGPVAGDEHQRGPLTREGARAGQPDPGRPACDEGYAHDGHATLRCPHEGDPCAF